MKLKITILTILGMFLFTSFVFAQVPDYSATVRAVFNEGGRNLNTKAGNGCFTEEVAYRIYQTDSNFGHLRKNPNQNNWNGHAVDAILHLPTGRAIDIISNSQSPGAGPAWQVDISRYGANDFMAPTAGCGGSGAPPAPQPQPPPQPPSPPNPNPNPPPIPGQPPPLPGTDIPEIIGIDPNPAKPGDKITIIGFYLGGTVGLESVSDGSVTEFSANLKSGNTTAEVNLPSNIAIGSYKIYVTGINGTSDYGPKILTIQTPAQAQPPPNIPEPQTFGDLIQEIFRWALALVGAAVFVNFLWAGFLWFTAAGRTGPIGQAKEKMFNSLIGAIILLASYLILNTINPDLVKQVFTLPGLGTSQQAPPNPNPNPILPPPPGGGTGTIESTVTKNLGLGDFPDPAFFNGKVWLAYHNGNNVNLFNGSPDLSDLSLYKSFPLSSAALPFARLTASGNTLWLAFRDGAPGYDVKLWRMDQNTTENLGPGYGNYPVALGYGNIAWQTDPQRKVVRRSLSGGQITTVRSLALPTGITRVLSNGSVVMQDQELSVTWEGRRFTKPWYAGNLAVVEDSQSGLVGRFNNNKATEFKIFEGEISNTPHASTDGGNLYAVGTWGDVGIRIAVIKTRAADSLSGNTSARSGIGCNDPYHPECSSQDAPKDPGGGGGGAPPGPSTGGGGSSSGGGGGGSYGNQIRTVNIAAAEAARILDNNKDCNDFLSESANGADGDAITVLDNVRLFRNFSPLTAQAGKIMLGNEFSDDLIAYADRFGKNAKILLLPLFFDENILIANGMDQVLVILHEVGHLTGRYIHGGFFIFGKVTTNFKNDRVNSLIREICF